MLSNCVAFRPSVVVMLQPARNTYFFYKLGSLKMIFEIQYPMVHFILISKECITNPSH